MKKIATLTALIALSATAALAEPSCTPAADGAAAPVWEAVKAFEEEGGVVKAFKINGGDCYEIYGSLDGTNMEVFFDPTTGEELERIDA
ncbi:Peptidase propeptide and YPEB domain-containing protein [Loktanella sp. DSM 29012]|uniref:PepSY domain-containing protein n=1 Tax=Loktanella gaetbuli TaxID=2881335 RepID=A0ABS8BTP8_9RHOB|nr:MULTISPECIES: PepSY domain-containing protein [Loktanella]MCB5199110.1 PepSY domain-containing protein [Loktanella gaetbuli]SEP63801.1 Peptidase propeptide and YPEB domain-containing protein [Loktanella sp. DSM 29012]